MLRPRATYKTSTPITTATTTTIHPYLNVTNSQDTNSDIVVYAAKPATESDIGESKQPPSPHLVFDGTTTTPATINNIEFIPTLEFISHTPRTLSCEHLQQCLPGCCATHHERTPPGIVLQQHESATESRLTFTIEKTTDRESESPEPQKEPQQQHQVVCDSPSSSVDTTELLQQQEVLPLSLTDTASLSTYFDEPTSSITIDIMEGSQKTTTTSATTASERPTTTATTSSAVISRTNNTTNTSQSNVPQQSSTNILSSLSDEPSDEIEEEIEEALEVSDEQVESLDTLPGPSKKKSLNLKSDQMFGIDLSDLSTVGDSEKLPLTPSGKSKKNSIDDDDQFKIDDDQLSGGKLAQHFVLEDSEELSVSLPKDKHEIQSVPQSEESLSLGLEDNNQAEQSLSNQSTSHDVSELHEEPIEEPDSLLSEGDYPLSLPEGAVGGDSNKGKAFAFSLFSNLIPKFDTSRSTV